MASEFESGVSWYTHMTVDIFFPEGHVCCALCPVLETYSRLQCRRTGEYLLDKNTTGFYCPLKIMEENNQ
jgi:hypothetical protein